MSCGGVDGIVDIIYGRIFGVVIGSIGGGDAAVVYVNWSLGETKLAITGTCLYHCGDILGRGDGVVIGGDEIGIGERGYGAAVVFFILHIGKRVRVLGLGGTVHVDVLRGIEIARYAALEVGFAAFLGGVGADVGGELYAVEVVVLH